MAFHIKDQATDATAQRLAAEGKVAHRHRPRRGEHEYERVRLRVPLSDLLHPALSAKVSPTASRVTEA